MSKRIVELYAFVTPDANGDEGICGYFHDNQWFAMVCSERERADRLLRPLAERIVGETGQLIRLIRLTERTDIEIIVPVEPLSKRN